MRIPITCGKSVIVDDEDAEAVLKHSWHYGNGYAKSRINGRVIRMHRFIMNPPRHMHIDHANQNGLDNRRSNLRIVRRNENMWNSVKKNCNGKLKTASKYKGVNIDNRVKHKKWCAEVWKEGKKIFTRRFYTEIDAAIAYNLVTKRSFGEYARLNNVTMLQKDVVRISKMIDMPVRQKGIGCVTFDKKWGKWIASLSQKNNIPRKYVGGFNTKQEAMNAVNRKESVAA